MGDGRDMEERPPVRMEGEAAATCGCANLIDGQSPGCGEVRGVYWLKLRGQRCPSTPPTSSSWSSAAAPSPTLPLPTNNCPHTAQLQGLPVAIAPSCDPAPSSCSQRACTLQGRAGKGCRAAQARAHSNEWRREKEDKEKELLKVSMDTTLPPRHSVGRWYVSRQNEPVRAHLDRAGTPGQL